MNNVSNVLIIVGLSLLFFGLLTKGIPGFGRLPGDIVVNRPNFSVYVPITAMIILSIVLTIIMRIINR